MRKLTNVEAVDRLSNNNPNIIFVTDYKNSREKSLFNCLVCNHEWMSIPKHLIKGTNGCPECGKKISRETKKYNITTNDFRNKVKDKTITIIGEYKSGKDRIDVKCNLCENKWSPKANYLMVGGGCQKCGHKETGRKCRKSHETFLTEIDKIYGGKVSILGEYRTGKDRIDVKCNLCSNVWAPVSSRLLKRGCPKCNLSKGQLLITKILKELNIDFMDQYILDGLKTEDGGTPIFDFVLFDNSSAKIIIEYDGKQHFKAVKRWGGVARLKQQQKVDRFKDDYCNENNIQMIRIPYTEYNNINRKYIENIL